MRPSWDEVWMNIAREVSRRSADDKYKVGTVIVTGDNTQVLSLGYNGDHAGGPNCRESSDPGESGFIHAEMNALIKLDYNNLKRRVMYVTLSPCKMCAKAIINAGINELVYGEDYRDLSGIDILTGAGIKVRKITQT
jgi:dCMP deaminase